MYIEDDKRFSTIMENLKQVPHIYELGLIQKDSLDLKKFAIETNNKEMLNKIKIIENFDIEDIDTFIKETKMQFEQFKKIRAEFFNNNDYFLKVYSQLEEFKTYANKINDNTMLKTITNFKCKLVLSDFKIEAEKLLKYLRNRKIQFKTDNIYKPYASRYVCKTKVYQMFEEIEREERPTRSNDPSEFAIGKMESKDKENGEFTLIAPIFKKDQHCQINRAIHQIYYAFLNIYIQNKDNPNKKLGKCFPGIYPELKDKVFIDSMEFHTKYMKRNKTGHSRDLKDYKHLIFILGLYQIKHNKFKAGRLTENLLNVKIGEFEGFKYPLFIIDLSCYSLYEIERLNNNYLPNSLLSLGFNQQNDTIYWFGMNFNELHHYSKIKKKEIIKKNLEDETMFCSYSELSLYKLVKNLPNGVEVLREIKNTTSKVRARTINRKIMNPLNKTIEIYKNPNNDKNLAYLEYCHIEELKNPDKEDFLEKKLVFKWLYKR